MTTQNRQKLNAKIKTGIISTVLVNYSVRDGIERLLSVFYIKKLIEFFYTYMYSLFYSKRNGARGHSNKSDKRL